MIRKARVTLEIVYSDENCSSPDEWNFCDLTGEIATVSGYEEMEPTPEDIEQMS